jgi:hypothetical protein
MGSVRKVAGGVLPGLPIVRTASSDSAPDDLGCEPIGVVNANHHRLLGIHRGRVVAVPMPVPAHHVLDLVVGAHGPTTYEAAILTRRDATTDQQGTAARASEQIQGNV